ncbi:ATP-dependent Clp protease proteolytic subunit [Neisseria sicca]|uniref:ATP-dependent Clp protease proteolytic subunit n=1 Tax=Neisseria sicca TaxID=490 RepID=UPI0034D9588B
MNLMKGKVWSLCLGEGGRMGGFVVWGGEKGKGFGVGKRRMMIEERLIKGGLGGEGLRGLEEELREGVG